MNGNGLCFCRIFSKTSLYMSTNGVNAPCIPRMRVSISCRLHDSRTKGLRIRSPFCELQEKYFSLELTTLNLKRNIKAIFREKFSSRRFNSGKIYIFKIIIFTRGPRTPYCSFQYICKQLVWRNWSASSWGLLLRWRLPVILIVQP